MGIALLHEGMYCSTVLAAIMTDHSTAVRAFLQETA
jgi:hypothetical protein